MSSTIIDNEFYSDRNLDVYEKAVLSYLIRFHNKKLGYSFPTRKQIQEDNGISTGKLNQVLQSLEDKGYITRANNPNKGGRNNIYYIHKYLVIKNNNENSLEPQREVRADKSTNSSSKDLKSNTEPYREPKKRQYNKTNKVNENGYVNNNYPVKTKYHNSFNEHFRKYSEEELESKLLKVQNSRR